jgi:subtilisin family serine protease
MQNEKIENLLNLALDATPEERQRSLDLNVGFTAETKTWEVIVKYNGTKEALKEALLSSFPAQAAFLTIVILSNSYAILTLPQEIVEKVAALPEITYMEKPKRFFFSVNNGKRVSCITPLQTALPVSGGENSVIEDNGRNRLAGKGVIVAVIDSGIDYSHPDFRNADGTTRILALWDQTIPGNPPEGFALGTEYTSEVINLALDQPTEQQRNFVCPSRDISGHGTHVAGIAAGNGRASDGRYRGVAFESELLIVKLGNPAADGFPRTTELMQAVDYCVRKASAYQRPLAVNISFGNNYGSHSGTSLVETFLGEMTGIGRTTIVVGSGNEGAAAVHTFGQLQKGEKKGVELGVSSFETSLNLQIWKSYTDEVEVALKAPGGSKIGPIARISGAQRFQVENTQILMYYGMPSPFSPFQEIYFEFIPKGDYLDGGIWEIQLLAKRIVQGNYNMWLPSGGVLNPGTGFLLPVEETTLTIPSTAEKVITVGAYDAYFDQPAAFSGRGYTRETNQVKPDLVAPGVDIISCAPGGGYASRTGTSMATPFVTGSAALLMQWGIADGNDRYLYGEKIKAYLRAGARQLPGFLEYPNPRLGYGALCTEKSLPPVLES